MDLNKDIKILEELAEDTIKYKMVETDAYTAGAITRVLKELETWKKIAKKLAEQVKREVVFYNTEGINFCEISNAEFGKCTKYNNGENCINCIIDWAKREVENE